VRPEGSQIQVRKHYRLKQFVWLYGVITGKTISLIFIHQSYMLFESGQVTENSLKLNEKLQIGNQCE
jgi:hypothetical protein